MSDSVRDLAHDHREINRQVLAAGVLARRRDAPAAELVAALGQLRDALFTHFALEEEGLFPFLAAALPALAERAHALGIAHDTICGALVRSFDLASKGADAAAIEAVFERFETAYANHSSVEAVLLDDVGRMLDGEQRAKLAGVLAGL
jgi:non-ribosomal peptide synthetase component F